MTQSTPSSISSDDQLVDRIIYLASLASRQREIDPFLDTLRGVTSSRWSHGQVMQTADRSALVGLEGQLKDYLIHQDPLRAFTTESLGERLRQAQNSNQTANRRALITASFIPWAASGLALALPYGQSLAQRALIAIPAFYVALHACTIWFFLTALANFKKEFRRAFVYICIGIFFMGLTAAHFFVIQVFGLERYPAFRYLGISAIVGLALLLPYLGLRIYARLLGIRTRLASLPLTTALFALTAAAVVALPHSTVETEAFFDLSAACLVAVPFYGLLSGLLARRITRVTTVAYARSMRWLLIFFLVSGIAGGFALAALFWLGEIRSDQINWILILLATPPQATLLYVGYVFKKEIGK